MLENSAENIKNSDNVVKPAEANLGNVSVFPKFMDAIESTLEQKFKSMFQQDPVAQTDPMPKKPPAAPTISPSANDLKFNAAVEVVLANEGGLVDNPRDPGGLTNHGISLRFVNEIPAERLKAYGIYPATVSSQEIGEQSIRDLTIEQAKNIYKGEFWDKALFGEIRSQNVINVLFDMVVNEGCAPAVKCAQRACMAVMRNSNILLEDGILGPKTLTIINLCGENLAAAMRSERASDYRVICALHPSQSVFKEGWLRRAYRT